MFQSNNPCIFTININNTQQKTNSFISCISARSAPQTLSLKDGCTVPFSKFLIIGLCNSSANCWFGIISLLIAPFYQKIYKPLKQDLFDIHHIADF